MRNANFKKIYKYEIYKFDWRVAETKSRSGGGFLGILGGGMPPSSNPDPISD